MSQTPKLRPQPQDPPPPAHEVPEASMDAATPSMEVDRGGVPLFTRRHVFYLLGFTLLAGALRLWDLGTWAFWVDEAHTFRDVTSPWDEFWERGTSRYPVSFLLLRYMADYTGFTAGDLNEEFMRLPFAFFGIASVPVLAIVARGMIGRRAALLSALFLALSPWHIYWSQNARSYSLVLFLILIAMGATYNGILRRARVQLVVGITLMFLAGLTHPSAFAIVAATMAFIVYSMLTDRELRDWLGGVWAPVFGLAVMGVALAVVVPVLEQANAVKGARFSLVHLLQTLVFFVGVPMLVAAGGGILVLFDRGHRSAKFLTAMAVLPLAGLCAVAIRGPQTVSAQYAFAVLPALLMLASVLIIALASVFHGVGLRSLTLRLVPLAIIVFHMLGQDYLYFGKEYGWRPRWSEAVHWVMNQARGNEGKALHVLTTNFPSVDYYFHRDEQSSPLRNKVVVESLEKWSKSLSDNPEAYLSKVVAKARKDNLDLWVIVTAPGLWEKDTDGRADQFLRENFRNVRRLPNWTGPKDMVIHVYHLE